MLKIFSATFLIITMLFLSGCWLFEENEIADAEMSADIDQVVNQNQNHNTNQENEPTNKPDEDKEKLKLEEIFVGTWWLKMEYPDFYSISKITIKPGKYNSKKWYTGDMVVTASNIYDETGAIEAQPTGELIDFEIDGQKIRFGTDDASLYGKISLDKNKSSASGDFITTLGQGTWYMANKKL